MAASAPSSTAVNASSGSKSSSSAAAEALRPPFFPFFPFFARSTQLDCASAPRGVPFRPSSAQLECFLPTSWPADHGSAGSDARHATCSFMAVPWGRLGSAQAWAKHRRPAETRMHRCNPEAAIIVIVLPAYSSGLCTGGCTGLPDLRSKVRKRSNSCETFSVFVDSLESQPVPVPLTCSTHVWRWIQPGQPLSTHFLNPM